MSARSTWARLGRSGVALGIWAALGKVPNRSAYTVRATPTWGRVTLHWVRAADSRTLCTAGSSSPTTAARMATTRSSSSKVKADRRKGLMGHPPGALHPQRPVDADLDKDDLHQLGIRDPALQEDVDGELEEEQ